MKANTVITSSGSEVYLNNIYEEVDRYIAELDAEDDEERKKLMRRPAIFRGMLKTIYLNLFKKEAGESRQHNRCSRIDYDNVEVLDELWDVYSLLAYKYNQVPSLLGFSLMTGISRDTFNDWAKGEYRQGSAHILSVKKHLQETEGALFDSAATGNPGAMFLLKANFNYREIGCINEQNTQSLELETPRQITQRRAVEKPDFPQEIE